MPGSNSGFSDLGGSPNQRKAGAAAGFGGLGGFGGGLGGGGLGGPNRGQRNGLKPAASLASAPMAPPTALPGFGHGAMGGGGMGAPSGAGGEGRRNVRNPMSGIDASADGDNSKTRSSDAITITADLPWMVQLRRYAVLSADDAEHVLHTCLREMGNIIGDLFIAESEAVTNVTRQAAYDTLRDTVTFLTGILSKLPESSFVDASGRPDAPFHNTVSGLCHLWSSSDTNQLSTVMRQLSLSRPAEAVSQSALTCRVVLPASERVMRNRFAALTQPRLTVMFVGGQIAFALAVMIGFAGTYGLTSLELSLPVCAVLAATGFVLSLIAGIGMIRRRNADDAAIAITRQCVGSSIAAFGTNGVQVAERQTSLGGLGRGGGGGGGLPTGGGAMSAGAPSVYGGATGGVDRSVHNAAQAGATLSLAQLQDAVRARYPHGVLMIPPQTKDTGSWVCIDARPISKYAMLIGIDANRRINLWNTAATDITGYVDSSCIGNLAAEKLKLLSDEGLDRVPRRVGEHAVVALENIVSGTVVAEVIIGDVRDVYGESVGYCFVAPSQRDEHTSTRAYVHEYLQLELWEGLANAELIAKHVQEIGRTIEVNTGGIDQSRSGRAGSGVGIGLGFDQSKESAGRSSGSTGVRKDSGEAPSEEPSAGVDLKVLHDSLVREIQKMRVTVRQLNWDALSATARMIATQWEWTNGERLLGAAARYHFAKASVGVEQNAPTSFRLPAAAARIVKMIINHAPSHCNVFVQHVRRSKRVSRISIITTLQSPDDNDTVRRSRVGSLAPPSENRRRGSSTAKPKFDVDAVLRELTRDMYEACATLHVFPDNTAIAVHLPCIRDVEDGSKKNKMESSFIAGGPSAMPATVCDCTVAVCLQQHVDQHNLGMMLLGIRGVSLTVCRDVSELQERLANVDMVIISNGLREKVEVDGDYALVVIPVVQEDVPFDSDEPHLRLPLKREDVHETVIAASAVVAQLKRDADAQREREEVLRARHDAPWTKGDLLGRGTFGVCFMATNDLTGGKMAVKQFETKMRDEAETERFMTSLINEIRILTKLEHPNIVHYFYCERSADGVFLFMELCEGSLQDIVKKRRTLPPHHYRRAVPVIMQQTLMAVAYLHNMNIIHRDLKPQNILIKGDRLKLTDFGTAHQLNQDETLRDTQGTLRFMAPEVYRAEAYNRTCDTWSIGCILCELLDVKVPFMQPGQHQLLGEIQQSDVVLSSATDVDPDAKDFINLCLQVRADVRPQVATLLLHPFIQAADATFRLSTLTKGSLPNSPAALLPNASNNNNGNAAQEAVNVPENDELEMPPAPRAVVAMDDSGDGFSLNSQ